MSMLLSMDPISTHLKAAEWIVISPTLEIHKIAPTTFDPTILVKISLAKEIKSTIEDQYPISIRISCQICHQFDHEAMDCPHSMNLGYGTKNS